jgi:nucleoside 2-deoxyribosyltransferase
MPNKATTAKEMAEVAQVDEGAQGNLCFVIMSFSGNPILETYYDEAVKPIVEEFNLNCVRVDQEHFNGEISKRIRRNIETSRLVIVDLTEDRPNCYFEAGYAIAKSIPVIFQRLDAPKYEPIFHFDVKDYKHILYGTAKDLREKLKASIDALLNQD